VGNAPEAVDLLVVGASELATPIGSSPRSGADLGRIDVIPGGALAVRGGRIHAVGPEADLRARLRAARVLDARGGTIVPGFVDAHTHPVFAGTREEEFEQRTLGTSYLEIARRGGGILSTVRAVRAASRAELLELFVLRLDRFLALGTTTIEAKTGYGLSLDDEAKCLEVIAQGRALRPVDCAATFLGAHDVPPEYRGKTSAYVEHLVAEMLPRAAGAAEYCDVFLEAHTFGPDEARAILGHARELGLGLRLHADQLSALGGAELAAEFQAASADHLEFVSDQGIEALARAQVIPVLCPLVPLTLRQEREAPARRMIESGLAPALSTDFNPGSCYNQSMPEVLAWAALRYRMTAAECLTAATLNAACSLGRGGETGSLEPGKRADVVVLDQPNHRHLCYELGRNPVRAVVAAGTVVVERAA
jgi:imidazolonepropionase